MKKLIFIILIGLSFNTFGQVLNTLKLRESLTITDSIVTGIKSGNTIATSEWVVDNAIILIDDTARVVGHFKVDSSAFVLGDVIVSGSVSLLNNAFQSAYLPTDSATVTTATLADTYYFVKGNFINDYSNNFGFTGDTLQYIGTDTIIVKIEYTTSATSSKNAAVTFGFSDNGGAKVNSEKDASFSAGETKSITHFFIFELDPNEKVKFVVKSSAATTDITNKNASLILEQIGIKGRF